MGLELRAHMTRIQKAMRTQSFFDRGIRRPPNEIDRKHEDKDLDDDVESGRDLPPKILRSLSSRNRNESEVGPQTWFEP
jgi:hypothetical protein